jgi:protein-L-isoaspartate(D-aspartate) O-methyltransferase
MRWRSALLTRGDTAITAATDNPTALRAAMVATLTEFRPPAHPCDHPSVQRHQLIPDTTLEPTYLDNVVTISCLSAPSIVATQLDQLDASSATPS